MFKSDGQNVHLFRGHSYADAVPDCSVNDMLIKAAPFVNQLFFQMVDVTDLATWCYCKNAPDRIVNQN